MSNDNDGQVEIYIYSWLISNGNDGQVVDDGDGIGDNEDVMIMMMMVRL